MPTTDLPLPTPTAPRRSAWAPFPAELAAALPSRSLADLTRDWPRLHAGDAEPWPSSPAAQQAWAAYHAGQFSQAKALGVAAQEAADPDAASAWAAAWRAQAVYATYLAPEESTRLALLAEVAAQAHDRSARCPDDANAHYLLAYAVGRYSQAIQVSRALALGLGGQVRAALGRTLALRPRHADAHFALGTFHAEVVDSLGAAAAHQQDADAAQARAAFAQGLALHPASVVGRLEWARARVMLDGEAAAAEADALFAATAASRPQDAIEALEVARAQLEWAD